MLYGNSAYLVQILDAYYTVLRFASTELSRLPFELHR